MSRPLFSVRRIVRRALVLSHRFVFGTLLVMVMVLAMALYGALAWTKHGLASGWHFGKVTLTAQGIETGWDFSVRVDSLLALGPGFKITGDRIRFRPVLSKGFPAVYPAIRLSVQNLQVDLLPTYDSGSAQIPVFPALRWPMPWRVEVAHFTLKKNDKTWLHIEDAQLSSRGLLGFEARVSLQPGDLGLALPESLRDGVKCEMSARWKGSFLSYHLGMRNSDGDSVKLAGRRDRNDLRKACDTLFLRVDQPAQYLPDSSRHVLKNYQAIKVNLILESTSLPQYSAAVSVYADSLPLIGAAQVQMKLRGGLRQSWIDLSLKSERGGQAEITGEIPFKPLDISDSTLASLAKLRPSQALFAGKADGLILDVGGMEITNTVQVVKGVWVPNQLITAQAINAAGSNIHLAFYLRKNWMLAFEGWAGSKEPWAHAWTDTNVTYESAHVSGHVQGPKVQVKARCYGVMAYGAHADSVQCWNRVNEEMYRLDSARIWDQGRLWRGQGHVTWRRNGKMLPQGVELAFSASNPEYGQGFYSMPRPGEMDVRAENVAPHFSPYLPLARLARLARVDPRVTGTFHWRFHPGEEEGRVDAAVTIAKNAENVQLHLAGDWDMQNLNVHQARVTGNDLSLLASGQVYLGGMPFYDVIKAKFQDVRSLQMQMERVDLATWVKRFDIRLPLQSALVSGQIKFTPEAGMQGNVALQRLRLTGQPPQFEFGTLNLLGLGDTLSLNLATTSQLEPFFNSQVKLKVLHLFSAEPDFILDATVRDSLHLAARASLNRERLLRGAIDLVGAAELPGQAGSLRQVHLLTAFDLPLNANALENLHLESHALGGIYKPKDLPEQYFRGHLQAKKGVIKLDSLNLTGDGGKKLTAEASYTFRPLAKLEFKLGGEEFALNLAGHEALKLQNITIDGDLYQGQFQVKAKASGADFEYRKGAVLSQGRVENLAVDYHQFPKSLAGMGTPPLLQVKGTLVHSFFRHKIGIDELKAFWRGLMRSNKNKGSGSHTAGTGGGSGKSQPIELALQLDTKGQDNRIETEVCKLSFAGDMNVKGVTPFLLLTGSVISLKGEIGQSTQAYNLRDLELKWQNASPQDGNVTLEGDKKLKTDCNPKTEKTCHVTIRFEGRLDEARFTYETDCGGDAGEAIKPTAIINSVSRGCYSGDLAGGDNQEDYGKTLVNFITPVVNDRLTKVIKRGTLGWIRSAEVTGASHLVEGENAQAVLDEPVALNLESKEKYRMRLLGRAGFFPASTLKNPYDFMVRGEWRPPLEALVSDSSSKKKLKDKVTLDAGIETRPQINATTEERLVSRKVGLRYKYQFWKFW